MNLINQKVNHRLFESGTVVSQSETTVTVEFCDKVGTKKFIYPSAFESFLELSNTAAKAEMDDELRQIRECLEEGRRMRTQDDEKRHEEERHTMLQQKRALAKRRSAAKKAPSKAKKQTDIVPEEK